MSLRILKRSISKVLPDKVIRMLKKPANGITPLKSGIYSFIGPFKTYILLFINRKKKSRMLEIGPGVKRINNFETANILAGPSVDYVFDATKQLPFKDNTFDLIYSSHMLEHVPWFFVENTLHEWVRCLKPGGVLELWVPDGLKIAKAFVDAEENDSQEWNNDGWYRFNENHDPCVWASGRIFTYGDGTGNLAHPNWHRAIFSTRYLKLLLEKSGLISIRILNPEEVRGYDHGWINLGISGLKKS